MDWTDLFAIPGYGLMLYILCCAVLELVKALARNAYPHVEDVWLSLVYHGNLTGERKRKKMK